MTEPEITLAQEMRFLAVQCDAQLKKSCHPHAVFLASLAETLHKSGEPQLLNLAATVLDAAREQNEIELELLVQDIAGALRIGALQAERTALALGRAA